MDPSSTKAALDKLAALSQEFGGYEEITGMQPHLIIRDDRRHNLQISEDTGDEDEPVAVLLFTPDMQDLTNHEHIELSVEQARATYAWLGAFLAKHDGAAR